MTGVTGQDGSYLAELLLEKGYEVWGMARRLSTPNEWRLQNVLDGPHSDRFHLVEGDLGDSSSIYRLLGEIRPQEVYNLAAQSHVQVSFDVPDYTGDVTALGCTRLLEAIRVLGLGARFYQASSSEMYGKVVESPQTETTPFHPRSPYAVAKVYAFHITRNYREAFGLFAVNGILFNHESPRRGDTFVTRKITLGAAAIHAGSEEPLRLGNLDASRDWGFAGDYVEAMWMMLQVDDPQDYVVAMGETHSVREFCGLAFGRVGLPLEWRGQGLDEKGYGPDGQLLIEVDPRFFRPAEVDFLLGDASKALDEIGWQPKTSFAELVEMMVDSDLAG